MGRRGKNRKQYQRLDDAQRGSTEQNKYKTAALIVGFMPWKMEPTKGKQQLANEWDCAKMIKKGFYTRNIVARNAYTLKR